MQAIFRIENAQILINLKFRRPNQLESIEFLRNSLPNGHTFLRRRFTRRIFFSANIDTMILITLDTLTVFTSNQYTMRNVMVFILNHHKMENWNQFLKLDEMIMFVPQSVSWVEVVIQRNVWWNTEYGYQSQTIKAQCVAQLVANDLIWLISDDFVWGKAEQLAQPFYDPCGFADFHAACYQCNDQTTNAVGKTTSYHRLQDQTLYCVCNNSTIELMSDTFFNLSNYRHQSIQLIWMEMETSCTLFKR